METNMLGKKRKLNKKKAAMEMSVGTIVTIVLLMSVMVLGLFLVQQIFSTGTNAIEEVDKKVQDEIENMFNTGDASRVAIYPKSSVILEQGDSGKGFGISIKNERKEDEIFSYEVLYYGTTCDEDEVSERRAESLIAIGRKNEEIDLSSGAVAQGMPVKFDIPENIPTCEIEYEIIVRDKDDNRYGNEYITLKIE